MAEGVHKITEQFENELCKYTGAKYAVAVDNESNALFLALMYEDVRGKIIEIPPHTYMSVPCAIIHAGAEVAWSPWPKNDNILTGAYPLKGSNVIDSALRFTADMYVQNTYMCCSFTGPTKHLKLGKGGCILTDNEKAYKWFKKARFSGRNECSYHEDYFDQLGWNFYMNPIVSSLGLLLIQQFYNFDGTKKNMQDLSIPYPDLRKFPVYNSNKGI
jgi:dTDP-4-amino-4,6-dideoxygalactose transaminase